MGKYQLRQKAIRRINRFEITPEEIDDLIYLGDSRFDPELELAPGEPYATIKMMLQCKILGAICGSDSQCCF